MNSSLCFYQSVSDIQNMKPTPCNKSKHAKLALVAFKISLCIVLLWAAMFALAYLVFEAGM